VGQGEDAAEVEGAPRSEASVKKAQQILGGKIRIVKKAP
jgi:hypothetical protein